MFQLNFAIEGGGRTLNYTLEFEQAIIVNLIEERAGALLTAMVKALEDRDEEALDEAENRLLEPGAIMNGTRVQKAQGQPKDVWVCGNRL